MDDQYQSFSDDLSLQLVDSTHPLYLSPVSTAPAHSSVAAAYDDPSSISIDRDNAAELGPIGTGVLYAGFTLVVGYFALIFVFGTH